MEAARCGTGVGECTALFDGGNRLVRRQLEDLVDVAAWVHAAEVTIVYETLKKPSTGGRPVVFSRRNVEPGFVQARFPGSKRKVSSRDDDTDSTNPTYTVVPMRARVSLALLPADERKQIVGA